MKTRKPTTKPPARDPVARQLNRFNKAATHRDRKNDYRRTPKHRPRDFGVFFCMPAGSSVPPPSMISRSSVDPEIMDGSDTLALANTGGIIRRGAGLSGATGNKWHAGMGRREAWRHVHERMGCLAGETRKAAGVPPSGAGPAVSSWW